MLAAKGGHTETVQALVDADIYTILKASVKMCYYNNILTLCQHVNTRLSFVALSRCC